MAGVYQLLVDGQPVEAELYDELTSVEVEENLDLPGAIQINLPVNRSAEGELTYASDPRFRPFANVALIAALEGGPDECLFDGFVLSHRLHIETGVTAATLQVWGQDAEWLMNLEEKTREWVDVTDADVAASIFVEYGMSPAAENSSEDSPAHTEDAHTLMQRGTDIQFLRRLARRSGKVCRVTCGAEPGQYTGYFAAPLLDAEPVVTLRLNEPEDWNVDAMDIEWDITRPTAVNAAQALFNDDTPEGVTAAVTDAGLSLLDERSAADFGERPVTVLLSAPVDDAQALGMRATGLLRETGWVVRCETEADASRLNAIPRAGAIVQLDGLGSLNSGKYLVWSVRHTFTADAHRMKFVLVRNAFGPEPEGGLGGVI